MAARCASGIRLAAWRAHLDQSESERAEAVYVSLLRRNGDARRYDAFRGTRHDATPRTLRRAGHRCERLGGRDAATGTLVARGVCIERMLVRADVPQARRQTLQRYPGARR